MEECLFCKIAKKEISSKIEYEDEDFIAFDDISPKAPVHILIVPKRHIGSVTDLKEEDAELTGKMILLAQKLAKEKKIDSSGYRLVLNSGLNSGQVIDHIHLHLLGGQPLKNMV